MTSKINEALNAVQMVYKDLIEIGNNILSDIIKPADNLVFAIGSDINRLSIDEIKGYIWELQIAAYRLVEVKEKSLFKAELAQSIQKEKSAIEFNKAEGTATAKTNIALINSSEETVSQALYEYISSILKNKTDQLHRLVDCLKSILMARMQEIKFINIGTSSEIPATTNGRITLNE